MDGVDVIKALRGWTRVPILVLSARQASDEKVAALDAGADDYITKPFSMDELMARLRAAVRRTEGAPVAVREADLDEVVPMALGRVREDSVELDVPETLPMVHGAGGHDKIRTGTEDQKFGLSIRDGYAHAIARILDQPQLELTGLHCHLGSQITSVKPYLAAMRRVVGLMARLHEQRCPNSTWAAATASPTAPARRRSTSPPWPARSARS